MEFGRRKSEVLGRKLEWEGKKLELCGRSFELGVRKGELEEKKWELGGKKCKLEEEKSLVGMGKGHSRGWQWGSVGVDGGIKVIACVVVSPRRCVAA